MYIFCTVGIKYTTSSKASFFSCLTFIIVPFLNLCIYKLGLKNITVISVLICLAGIFLLSYTSDIGGFSLNIGDILCILGSLAGSFHITFLKRIMQKEAWKKPKTPNLRFSAVHVKIADRIEITVLMGKGLKH